jgi:hypothetical protein
MTFHHRSTTPSTRLLPAFHQGVPYHPHTPLVVEDTTGLVEARCLPPGKGTAPVGNPSFRANTRAPAREGRWRSSSPRRTTGGRYRPQPTRPGQ